MTKIALLKADIIRMYFTFNDLSFLSLESMMQDLEAWYRNLPEEMSVANLSPILAASRSRRKPGDLCITSIFRILGPLCFSIAA